MASGDNEEGPDHPESHRAAQRDRALLVEIPDPASTHHANISSVVYRLSEVMFGSLLASYVIGFLAASSQQSDAFRDGSPLASPVAGLVAYYFDGGWNRWWPPIIAVDYLLISIAFASLTAASYLVYHAGVLTLPQLDRSSLAKDFIIALSQAVLFGLSILAPQAFVLALGIFFMVSLTRKRSVSRGFEAEALRQTEQATLDRVPPPQRTVGPNVPNPITEACRAAAVPEIRRAVADGALVVWKAPTKRTWAVAAGLCLLGGIVIVLSSRNIDAAGQVKREDVLWLLFVLPIGASVAAITIAFRELAQKGGFLTAGEHDDDNVRDNLASMKKRVKELAEALSDVATTVSARDPSQTDGGSGARGDDG